ncbi:MAG: patatin-like phospholipase family protein [Anaerolineales bacterium]|nr:patatin-like phospholipase family protein [Chloroflexota bacterium]MBL6980418.1 patatin-like phospholipase family protein [Anaerolineales bacterium]
MTEKQPINAVFEGGGVKGVGLVGAVSVTEEMGYQFRSVAGTSAGAIVAAMLAAGYTAGDMKDILDELNYNDLKDRSLIDKIPLVGPMASIVFEKGIYEGRFFENLMRSLLETKNIRTFGDLINE